MLSNVFMKSLWEQRRSLVWWSVGFFALIFITVLFYPSVSELTEINALLGDDDSVMRAFVGSVADMTSPEGYLNSQLYFIMIPLLFIVFAVAQGSGSIAGEEERGTLYLLLSNPLTRSKVLTHKFLAMVVSILFLALISWVWTVIAVLVVDMDIRIIRLGEVTLSAALLGLVFGAMALAFGSGTGKKGISIGVTSAVAVFTNLLNALALIVDALEPFSKLSPFYYYTQADPLTNGLEPAHLTVLLALAIVFLAIGLFTFERRDLGV